VSARIAVSDITNSCADGPNCQMEYLLRHLGSLPWVYGDWVLARKEKNQQRPCPSEISSSTIVLT
jgi:hypothetical protein